jgi:hypothetical protein
MASTSDFIPKKFINVTDAPDVSGMDYFIGTRDNGDGTSSDYKYSLAQIAGATRKAITVGTTAATLTDSFFSNTISSIMANNQAFVVGDDFTQSGTTITLLSGIFISGKTIIAFT